MCTLDLHAGRENTEERWNGNLCDNSRYHVLHHASPPNLEGDFLVIILPVFAESSAC